jgi:hypothetical protein
VTAEPTKRRPPKKEKGHKTGPRRFNGSVLDVDSLATRLGATPKHVRAQVARGLLPYRRRGGRIVFLAAEIDEFLKKLPGVTVEQALANVAARHQGEETPR